MFGQKTVALGNILSLIPAIVVDNKHFANGEG